MTPHLINIHTVSARYMARNGEFTLHSFDDFLETDGPPMEEDLEDEQTLADDNAWVSSGDHRLHYDLGDLFARFVDRDGKIHHYSLRYLHEMGTPVCGQDDKPLDLDSDLVFSRGYDPEFVELMAPGQKSEVPAKK